MYNFVFQNNQVSHTIYIQNCNFIHLINTEIKSVLLEHVLLLNPLLPFVAALRDLCVPEYFLEVVRQQQRPDRPAA